MNLRLIDKAREGQIQQFQAERLDFANDQTLKRCGSPEQRWLSPRLSDKHIIRRLKEEFKVVHNDDILETILKLREKQTNVKSFLHRLSDLMEKFNHNKTKPSLKKIWKWLRNLMEEYMSIQG